MVSGGMDVAWAVTPARPTAASDDYDYYNQLLYNISPPPPPPPPPPPHHTPVYDFVTTTDQDVCEYRHGRGEVGGDTKYIGL